MRTAYVALALLALACSSKDNSNNNLDDCAPDGSCPAGYQCRVSDNTCQLAGSVDAAIIDMRPPPPDVMPDAMPGAAPNTTITTAPPALGDHASVTFTFTSDQSSATFECSLDAAAFTSCSSPFTFTVADGSHTFEVRAVANGQTDATPASDTFVVDTVPPDTTITGGTSGSVDSNAATFTFTATEAGSTFQCSLDGQPFTSCVSGIAYGGLALGMHTFAVEATDPAGNTDPTPATQTWTAESITPGTTILTGPLPDSNSTTANFTFTSDTPGSTFTCSLDGGPAVACTSPTSYPNLGDGQHTFSVTASFNGVSDPNAATYVWTIDTVGPIAKISGGITGTVACSSLDFQYTTEPQEGDATFICALVTGAGPPTTADYAPCSNHGDAFSGLLDATQYTFSVIAIDPVGNHGPADSITFTVDAAGPGIQISSPAGNVGPAFTVDFTASDASSATYACDVTGGPSIPNCHTGQLFSGLAPGSHTVTVSGTDSCGNTSSTSSTVEVVISTVVSVSQPCGETTGTMGSIIYSPGMSASVVCNLDGTDLPPGSCTLGGVYNFNLSSLDGSDLTSHTITVTGYDANHNVVGMDSCSWMVDSSGPTITPTLANNPKAGHDVPPGAQVAPGGAIFVCPAPPIVLTCDPSHSDDTDDCPATTIDCTVDHGAFSDSCDRASLASLLDSAGLHTLTTIGYDSLGNVGVSDGTSQSFYIDAIGPIFSPSVKLPADWGPSGQFAIVMVPGPTGPSGFAGAEAKSGPTGVFTLDITDLNPNLDGLAPVTNACVVSGASGPSGACGVIAGTGNSLTLTFASLNDADNPYTASIELADECGNVTTQTVTWNVDTTPPHIIFTSEGPTYQSPMGPSGALVAATCPNGAVQYITQPPEYAGAAAFECAIGGAALSPGACAIGPSGSTGSVAYTGLPSGSGTVSVEGTDEWGNTHTATGSWLVDATAPTLQYSRLPVGATGPADALGYLCGSSGTIAWNTVPLEPGTTNYDDCNVVGPSGGLGAACGSVSPTGAFVSGLQNGYNTISVTPTDACGNAHTFTSTFFVDGAGPTGATGIALTDASAGDPTVVCGGPSGATVGIAYGFQSPDPNLHVLCSMTGPGGSSPMGLCGTTGASYVNLPNGSYNFQVEALDSCSKEATEHLSFTIENGAPTAPSNLALSGASGGVDCSTQTPTLTFSEAPGAPASTHYLCAEVLAGVTGSLTNCDTGSAVLGNNGDGSFGEVVEAQNACGQTASASITFAVDTLAPTVSLTGPTGTTFPNGSDPFTTASPHFALTVTSAGNPSPTVSCNLNPASLIGGGFTSSTACPGLTGATGYSGLTDLTGPSGAMDDPYTLSAHAVDRCAHGATGVLTFAVDATAPTGHFSSPASGSWTGPSGATGIAFTASDTVVGHSPGSGLASVTGVLDGTPDSFSVGGPFAVSGPTSDGAHSMTVTLVDHLGQTAVISDSWSIDATAPSVTGLACVKDASTVGSTGSSGIIITENNRPLTKAPRGSGRPPHAAPHRVPPSSPTLAAVQKGPRATGPQSFEDVGPPVVEKGSACPIVGDCPPQITGAVACSFAVTSTDHLGAAGHDDTFACNCWLDDGATTDCTTTNTVQESELSPGQHTFNVTCADAYGNSNAQTYTFTENLGPGHVFLLGADFIAVDEADAIGKALGDAAFFSYDWDNYQRYPFVRGFALPQVDQAGEENALDALAGSDGFGEDQSVWYLGDFTPANVAAATPAALADALVGADILLVYNQQQGNSSMETLGKSWQGTLDQFVSAGGVVIVLDGLDGPSGALSNTYELLDENGSDLLPGLTAATGVLMENGQAIGEEEDIFNGEDDDSFSNLDADSFGTFAGPINTVSFDDDGSDDAVLAVAFTEPCDFRRAGETEECTSYGDPVLLHKKWDVSCEFDYVVDANRGSDQNAGTCLAPFKTITQAFATVAALGGTQTIKVRPGFYDSVINGEKFPLQVPANTCLVGDPNTRGEGCGRQQVGVETSARPQAGQVSECAAARTLIWNDPAVDSAPVFEGFGPSGTVEGFLIGSSGVLDGNGDDVPQPQAVAFRYFKGAANSNILCNAIGVFGTAMDIRSPNNDAIEYNLIEDGEDCISIMNSDGNIVSNNDIFDNTGIALDLSATTNTTVTNNEFDEDGTGINLSGPSGVLINGNHASDNEFDGIDVFNVTNVTIEDNYLEENGQNGIDLVGGSVVIEGNTIDFNGNWGVLIAGGGSYDLGGGGQSVGANLLSCNGTGGDANTGDVDIIVDQTVFAEYNVWDNFTPLTEESQVDGENCESGTDVCYEGAPAQSADIIVNNGSAAAEPCAPTTEVVTRGIHRPARTTQTTPRPTRRVSPDRSLFRPLP